MKILASTFLLFVITILLPANLKAAEEWDGVNDGGVVVLPKAIAEYCEVQESGGSTRPLNQEDVVHYAEVASCLKEILRLKNDPSSEVLLQAQELAELILRQNIYISVAEGMGQKVYAFEYPDKVLKELSETLSTSTNNKEILASIMFLEKENAYLQNKILQIKATEMQLNETINFSNSGGR